MQNNRYGIMSVVGAAVLAAVGPALSSPAPGPGKRSRRAPPGAPRPNIGRNHPDYGLSISAHATNKLARTGRPY